MRRGPGGGTVELRRCSAYPSRVTARARKPAPLPPPSPAEEEAAYLASLVRAGKAVAARGALPPGATHRIVVGPDGAKKVRRKRYSAV